MNGTLVAVGTIWSWVASHTPEFNVLMWLPGLLVAFLAFRAVALTIYIDFTAGYLADVEKTFALTSNLGFEQQFKNKATLKRMSAYVFWILLFLVTIIIPCAYNA